MGDPSQEIEVSDQIYDYIVFKGTDVKDLKIEEAAPKDNHPPVAMPNDPAIVGVSVHLLTSHGPLSHDEILSDVKT